MHHHHYRNFRIIRVMFWSFPYLLWQTFGNISGFFVGVLLAVILTQMFNGLFRQGNWNSAPYTCYSPLQKAEPQLQHQEAYRKESEPYQDSYRAEMEPHRGEERQLYQARELQPEYEEMLVLYSQKIPPLEQT
jgi:hypothetical protein